MKLFDTILKYKTLTIFIFLFLVIAGVAMPNIAKANWNPTCWEWLWGKTSPNGNLLTQWRFENCVASEQLNNKVLGVLGDVGGKLLAAVVVGLSMIITGVFAELASISGQILSSVISTSSSTCYNCAANVAVSTGWPEVRDLANMFIVLGFVVVGIAFTLRLEGYGSKKILIRLIMIALVVNFSMLMCGVIIDASNIAMNAFMRGSGFFESNSSVSASSQISQIWNNFDINNVGKSIGVATALALKNVILFLVFVQYSMLFIGRYIGISFLVILSPLGLVMSIFPATQKYSKMWWEQFLGWCFIGIPAGFSLYLADKVAVSVFATGSGATFLMYLMPSAFMYAGYKLSKKLAPMGADAIMGAVNSAVGVASGAVIGAAVGFATGGPAGAALGAAKGGMAGAKGGSKGVTGGFSGGLAGGEKAGLTGTAQAVSSGFGNAMERIGLRQPGTTASANAKRVNEHASLMSNAYTAAKATGDTATMDRVKNMAINGRGSQAGAAFKTLADAGDLHDTFKDKGGLGAMAARASYAESVGATGVREKMEKSDPNLRAYNETAVNTYMKENTGATREQAQHAVVGAAVQKMGRQAVRDMSAGAVTPAFMGNMSSQQRTWAMEEAAPAVREKMNSFARPGSADHTKAFEYYTSPNIDPHAYGKYQEHIDHIQKTGNMLPPPLPKSGPMNPGTKIPTPPPAPKISADDEWAKNFLNNKPKNSPSRKKGSGDYGIEGEDYGIKGE